MASIDRVEICNAIEHLLESDATLYGSSKLINYITDDVVKFENAKVGVDRSYKMFLKCMKKEKLDTRMGKNSDYALIVEYRVEGLMSNYQTAFQNIDDIDERIDYICDNEMWTGNNLSSHYTNTECTVTDVTYEGSECDVKKDEGCWKVECEGSIRVQINRVKS